MNYFWPIYYNKSILALQWIPMAFRLSYDIWNRYKTITKFVASYLTFCLESWTIS